MRRWFAIGPLATDQERRRKLLHMLVGGIAALATLAALFALPLLSSDPYALDLLRNALAVLGAAVVGLALSRKWLTAASWLFLLSLAGLMTGFNADMDFLTGAGLFFLTLPILMAAVILPSWAGFGVATVTSGVVLVMVWRASGEVALPQVLGFYTAAGISWLAARSLERALFALRVLNAELEQRVAARTADLAAANSHLAVTNAELAQANDQLGAAYAKLKELDRLKSRFVSIVSHELRTPLAAIQGFAEMIASGLYGAPTGGMTHALERILANTQRLLGLVNDLLDQARMEEGRLSLSPAPFAPADLLRDLDSTLRALVEKKGLYLRLELDPALPEKLIGDAKRLLQILINLVNNAAKFTETGGITVTVTRQVDRWQLTVSDTGPGIAPDAQGYIFEPFRQVDDTATRQHTGFGLGLAIVKQLTELMGGTVRVTSEVGGGTTFTVNLPLTFLPAGGV